MTEQKTPEDELIPCLIDMATGKPGCVLLQAVALGGFDPRLPLAISAGDWVTHPTSDMKILHGTKAEWEAHAKNLEKKK
jgi:hypothetical protein